MAWLDANVLALADLAQPQLELWLVTTPQTRRKAIGAFIRWTNARRLTHRLEVPMQFDKAPVLLPATLARLVEQQIANPLTRSVLQPTPGSGPVFLFPGPLAHPPRRPHGLTRQPLELRLPTLAAHNTAVIAVAADLPPIVANDLFGIHVSTAIEWAALAQDSWADHLAARKGTE
ncbi:hypothetical protein ACFVWZ_21970 [Streptomyces sp. NPDC058200]|uniref:hypothetical protein n=1 Tax=Streptomyces sp. NPDC058200 TaxID=3346378 RepID=UPI0036E6CF60